MFSLLKMILIFKMVLFFCLFVYFYLHIYIYIYIYNLYLYTYITYICTCYMRAAWISVRACAAHSLGKPLRPMCARARPKILCDPRTRDPKKFVDNSIMNLKVRCQRQHGARGGTTEEGRQLWASWRPLMYAEPWYVTFWARMPLATCYHLLD